MPIRIIVFVYVVSGCALAKGFSLCVTLQKVCVQGSVTGSRKISRHTGQRQSSRVSGPLLFPRPSLSDTEVVSPSLPDSGAVIALLRTVSALPRGQGTAITLEKNPGYNRKLHSIKTSVCGQVALFLNQHLVGVCRVLKHPIANR